jgi:hypothetical protein
MFSRELCCPECNYRTVVGLAEAIARLQLIGRLRRDKDPDESLVSALLEADASLMTCPTCKRRGLVCREAIEDDWDDWQTAVLCEVCREAIDPERLEFLPETKRCAACQGKAEAGTLEDDEPEFCRKCGGLVELRVSRGSGITRIG